MLDCSGVLPIDNSGGMSLSYGGVGYSHPSPIDWYIDDLAFKPSCIATCLH